MSGDDSVSVVIPAYNEAPRIGRALASVLSQTRPVEEIIVVDDGSTDGTGDAAVKFEGVTVIRQDNQGLAAARNRGIAAARGAWVALLDGDDEWFPGHIENAQQVLQRHPELAWFCAAFERRLENGRTVFTSRVEPPLLQGNVIENYFAAEAETNFSRPSAMIIRRSIFDEIGLFNVEINYFGEDLDMWYRIACQHPHIGFSSQPGCVYWEKKNSITTAPTDIPRFLRRIEITQQVSVVSPQVDRASGPDVLLRRWVIMALKAAIKQRDRQSMRLLASRYADLLPVSWRTTARLMSHDFMLRIAHAGYLLRNR